MLVDDECDHGSMPLSCPVCLGPVPDPPSVVGRSVVASRESRCPGCADRIDPGDQIARTETGWMHEHCAEEETRG